VALLLGGEEAARGGAGLPEKRLLNVVEEMALASGVPVPPAFVIRNERGINAFAAGYGPNDAVVVVTEGCLTHLTRDELQGVVAHEFSHIYNGDMRRNLRLLAAIFALAGWATSGCNWSAWRPTGRARRTRGPAPLLLIGLILAVVGGLGALFARLMQAAISRQREYLADASAVQFTRNPLGIGGALLKSAATPTARGWSRPALPPCSTCSSTARPTNSSRPSTPTRRWRSASSSCCPISTARSRRCPRPSPPAAKSRKRRTRRGR
jgi:Zn-dependent protease with chaperone function